MGDETAFAVNKIREIGTQSGTVLIPIERGARRIFPAEGDGRHCPTSSRVGAHLAGPTFFPWV